MKSIPLQLLTVRLENGRQGVFVGLPIVYKDDQERACQVEDVWFSEPLRVPLGVELFDFIKLIQAQLSSCSCGETH